MPERTISEDAPPTTGESFAAMLDESLGVHERLEGSVVKGTILGIENDLVLIDVGLKSEGYVSLREFSEAGQPAEVKIGDVVDVYLVRMENKNGEAILSREKARREEAWNHLEEAFKEGRRVSGTIFGRVKGGFTVDLSGAAAFLPGSQVDLRPIRDISHLMGNPQTFQILKMDRRRSNIVVSRRAVLEESRAEARSELISNLQEGQVREGVVKNITDYGAFVDLGGVDGLLHVTDIAWRRINHPSEVLNIGETVNVKVIRFNSETQRISLGMKQLEEDPWEGVEAKYTVDSIFKGRVTNITDYGAFVELEPGVEGLVHVSEMSWTKKNMHPGKIVSTSQEVEVKVLDVDHERRRISLGLKQCMSNPWGEFGEAHPVGSIVEGEVKNITEFGMFIGLNGDIDGMAHLSDLDWARPGEEALTDYKKGDTVKAKVLEIDIEKERVSLGIKQLTEDPYRSGAKELKKGSRVTCTVTAVQDKGIEVRVGDQMTAFVRKGDLSSDRSEQRPDRLAAGDKVDVLVTSFDSKSRKLSVSIKALEVQEEKQAMAQYGSSDSGASLGDILGAAIHKHKKSAENADEAEAKEAKKRPEKKADKAEAKEAKKAKKKPEKKAAAKKAEKKTTKKASEKTEPAEDTNAEGEEA